MCWAWGKAAGLGGLHRGSGSGSPLPAPPEEMTQVFSTKPQADKLAACLAAPAHRDRLPGDVGGTPRDGGAERSAGMGEILTERVTVLKQELGLLPSASSRSRSESWPRSVPRLFCKGAEFLE